MILLYSYITCQEKYETMRNSRQFFKLCFYTYKFKAIIIILILKLNKRTISINAQFHLNN